MNTLHRSIFLCQLLLHLGTVCEGLMQTLCRRTGESVTLSCHYDIKHNGPGEMCWGRAQVPTYQCSNTIVTTDGENLTWRESERYQLQSGVTDGNVSLTIISVTEKDSGIYGCRVWIPGWFNDVKSNFNLTVVKEDGETEVSTATENTPHKPTAGEWTTPPARTDGSEVPAQGLAPAQESSPQLSGNAIRIGAVIFVPGLILAIILKLGFRQKKKQFNDMELDHSALTGQAGN